MNLSLLLALTICLPSAPQDARPSVLVVVGAPGEEQYAPQFREWAERWKAAAEKGNAQIEIIGLAPEGETPDREVLREAIARHTSESSAEFWIVLIGHGTWDGKVAKFNLRGPDVAASELGDWVAPVTRPLAFINCASSSSPFMTSMAGPRRVVITSTRAGSEYNYSRFGDYLSRAIVDPAADLDKDEQTSLLEAFLAASAAVREFYASESRLATEHALLDDNGDGKGTPSEWFAGLRAVKSPREGAIDGLVASQWRLAPSAREQRLPAEVRARRDALEQELEQLRPLRSGQSEEEYLGRIEPLLLELARIYAEAEAVEKSAAPPPATTEETGAAREKSAPPR